MLHSADASALLVRVLRVLDDDKALDVVSIPLAGRSVIADYMVIASGGSSRQVLAMAEHLERMLKKCDSLPYGSEGATAGDWVLIDAGDVIIHLFRPEVREFYQLEKMWSGASKAEASEAEVVTINHK